MTIASTTVATTGAACNGATKTFSFDFSIADYGAVEAEDQIEIILQTVATGVETILTRGTGANQYSVSINGDQTTSPGGSITTVTTYSSSYKIWIRLAPSFLQATSLSNQGPFLSAVIMAQFDQMQRQINELKDELRRTPRVSVPAGSSFDGLITGPFTANYGLTMNGTKTGFSLSTALASGVISSTMAAFCNASSLANAQSALGDWSTLGIASGGQISFNSGDVSFIHAPNFLLGSGGQFSFSYGGGAAIQTLIGTNTSDASQVLVAVFQGDRATYANNDNAYISLRLSNNAGTQTGAARINWKMTDITNAAEVGMLYFSVMNAGTMSDEVQLTASVMSPVTASGNSLGSASLPWLNGVFSGSVTSSGATSGIGYATGSGLAVTQITSRTTGVTINAVCGAITLVSAAGSTTPATFTVTNSAVAATDTIILNQKSGTDKYTLSVSAVAAGSFDITFNTKSGTTTEQPVFNFSILKAVAA